MIRRLSGALIAVVALAGLVPGPARANHCNPLLIFSGFSTPAGFQPGLNPGAGGCTAGDMDTNYLFPGSTHFRVATNATPVNATGEVLLDGVPVTLTFTPPAAAGGRWNSQLVEVGSATEVEATVATATGVVLTTTYRTVA